MTIDATRDPARPDQHEDQHPGIDLLFLALAAAAFALAQTAIVPGIRIVGAELDATASDVGWALTAYLISAAILTPVFGRLGDMFGKKRMLIVSLALFAAGQSPGSRRRASTGRRAARMPGATTNW